MPGPVATGKLSETERHFSDYLYFITYILIYFKNKLVIHSRYYTRTHITTSNTLKC